MYTGKISMAEGDKILNQLASYGYQYYDQAEKYGERAPTDNLRQRLHNVSKFFTNSGDFTYRSNTAQ